MDRDPFEPRVALLEFWKIVGDGVLEGDDAIVYRDANKRRRERLTEKEVWIDSRSEPLK